MSPRPVRAGVTARLPLRWIPPSTRLPGPASDWVEQGFEAALTHKHSPASVRPRIFDGVAEAKLVARACSEPPKGCARWTLKLLETAVVELNIVERASDNTIGRTLKKHTQAAPTKAMGHPAGWQRRLRSRHGGCAGSLSEAA